MIPRLVDQILAGGMDRLHCVTGGERAKTHLQRDDVDLYAAWQVWQDVCIYRQSIVRIGIDVVLYCSPYLDDVRASVVVSGIVAHTTQSVHGIPHKGIYIFSVRAN